jgi:hypoxanthine phosphoribosyltransferase
MKSIYIKDKEFELSIPEHDIAQAVKEIADAINEELKDENPLFICVLNGAFMFASDLMKRITIPSEITFVKLSSYQGTESTGKVRQLIGLDYSVTDRTLVILEDIVDTGITMEYIQNYLWANGANKIRIASIIQKPDALVRNIKVDYVGIKIPNHFIIGYGLDYDGYGRNLPEIYTLKK